MLQRHVNVLRLTTFGGLRIDGDDGAPRLRRTWLAMLAVLAAAGEHGVSRERFIAIFWPESDEEHARQSARQALYALRKEIGGGVIRTAGSSLSLDTRAISCDAVEFRAAVAAGDHARAVRLARQPFLDAFYLPGASAFERWAEEERTRIAITRASALMSLATEAARAGQLDLAVEWWRELTTVDPLSGRFAVGFLKALAARGDRAEALAFARQHQALIRRELEADPDPEVRRLEAELRAMPSLVPAIVAPLPPGVVRNTPSSPDDIERVEERSVPIQGSRRIGTLTTAGIALVAVAILAVQRRDSLASIVSRQVRPDPPPGSVVTATSSSAVASRLYEEGVRAYLNQDVNAARHLMRSALAEDSTFAMAAFYEALLAAITGDVTPDGRHTTVARRRALLLARRAPDRERLTITASLLADEQDPRALAVAESLATRYSDDPGAFATLGRVRTAVGDWAGAVTAIRRAIALDELAEPSDPSTCRVCRDYEQLADVYLWWDSLGAAERTAQQYLREHPGAAPPLRLLTLAAARLGNDSLAHSWFKRLAALGTTDRALQLNLDLRLEDYEGFARGVNQLLASSAESDWSYGAWYYLISLRNQGRLIEAARFHLTGELPGLPAPPAEHHPDQFNAAILAFERGNARAAATTFRALAPRDTATWGPGHLARGLTWYGTLAGMALATAGDTLALRVLADSVEQWGRGSLYGRDRKAHHYLRGMVHALAARHTEAVGEFRAAIYSPSLGFSRVNYELARSLLHLGRPTEAADVLGAALRGELDASNLYVTRTELHELLAQAFDRAGVRDSAAVHYRAVVKAWQRSDPAFQARRHVAADWLATFDDEKRRSW